MSPGFYTKKRGSSVPPETTPAELIGKVEQCVESSQALTPAELALFRQMAVAWTSWVAFGKGFKWIVSSLGLLSALLGSLAVIGAAVLYVWATVTGKKP